MRRHSMLVTFWPALLTTMGFPAIASLAHADWPACGLDLTPLHGNQYYPAVASDMAGGVIVVWSDGRAMAFEDIEDIYAQRLTASGEVAPGWPANGVPLCAAAGGQSLPEIDSDGVGGAIAVWFDYRNGDADVFAQRVTGAGAIAPGWPSDGLPIAQLPSDQRGAKVCGDGAGGAFVTWYDNQRGTYEVFLLRLTADGQVAPGWPETGLPVSSTAGLDPAIVSDGAGGVLIAWTDQRAAEADIAVQRITGAGAIASGWPTNGLLLGAESHQYQPLVVSDGAHGVIVAWGQDDFLSGTAWNVYAQRVTASGAIATGWPTGGVPLCSNAANQTLHALVPDGAGGAIAAWSDFRGVDGLSDVYVQRVDASGTRRWTVDGVLASPSAGGHYLPRAIPDGSQGAILVWQNGALGIRALRITGDGLFGPGWGEGVMLCTSDNLQQTPVLAPVCGGAIVAWQRQTGIENWYDVMALGLGLEGTVGQTGASDGQPPSLTVTISPNVLFPPNHQMVTIHATVEARDDCDRQPSVVLQSITSSEPDEGGGDGDASEDIQGAMFGEADFEFQLRAERAASGSGRTYVVCYQVTDASGNSTERCAEVRVPRSRAGQATLIEAARQATLVIPGESGSIRDLDAASVVVGTEFSERFASRGVEYVDHDGDGLEDLAVAFAPASERSTSNSASSPLYAYWEDGDGSYLTRLQLVADVPDDDRPGSIAWVKPNPAKGAAVLHFRSSTAGFVKVTVLDVAGRIVDQPVSAWYPAGLHQVSLHARLRAEGVYLYRVETPSQVDSGKFVFLK